MTSSRLLSALSGLLLTSGLLSAQSSAQPDSLTPLVWHDLSPDSLTPQEAQALRLAPDLRPEQWGLKRADALIGRLPAFFLDGKIGSGTGYGYYAAFGFAGSPLRLVWTGVTFEYAAASHFAPTNWAPFSLMGCLFLGPDHSFAYAAVVDSPSPTAQAALTTDTLVRPSAWYEWASGALRANAPLPQRVIEQCRAALAQQAEH
jgi:hypothetical protein